MKAKSETIVTPDGKVRKFTCKRCGKVTEELYPLWRSKIQKDRNICLDCVRKHNIHQQEMMELNKIRAENAKFYHW